MSMKHGSSLGCKIYKRKYSINIHVYLQTNTHIVCVCVCVYTKVKEKQKFFENPETDLWNLKYKPKVKLPEQQNVYVQEIKY